MTRVELEQQIGAIRSEFSGRLGLAARHLSSGEDVLVEPDTRFPTASVFKIGVMIEVVALAAEGRLDMQARRVVEGSDQIGGTGVLGDLDSGLNPTIRDLVTLMIIASDNTATNMLIDLVGGVDRINERLNAYLGSRAFEVHNRIDFKAIDGDVRRLAEATPRAVMELMSGIARGQLINRSASQLMIDIMSRQLYLDQFPRYLDYHRSRQELGLPDDFKVACKTGVFPGVRADAGAIFTPEGAIAYCSMTEGSQDMTDAVENEASVTNGRLGRLLLQYWWPGAAERNVLLPSRYL